MGLGYFAGATSIPIYGGGDGGDFVSQKNAIKEGADIIVATPGKLLTHLNMEYADFSKLRHLILDEADRMLDMGFFDDIARIIGFLPEKRQSLLFSATMPPKIRQLAKKILHNPKEVNIAISKPAEGVLQAAYLVHNHQKIGLIKHLLKEKQDTYKSIIIFASTKLNVKELHRELVRNKMGAKAIHSDLDQNEREAVLNSFRNREFQVLVATDILSRGIDIKEISLIINYDVPHDAEDYVHRVGRTARAESTGVALTFINEKDVWRFQKIEQLLEKEVNKVPLPEHLGEGPKYEKKKAPRFNKGRNFRKGSGGRPGGRSGGRNKRR